MDNLVIITSVCYIKDIPLSYTNTRSVFTTKERYEQLIGTIVSIRERIPDVFILLVEYSPFSDKELQELGTLCNYVYNLYGEDLDDEIFSPYKAHGERLLVLRALKMVYSKYKPRNIFKISGRYRFSDKFDYAEYNNDMMNFFAIRGNISNINTCGYKICWKHLDGLIKYFENTRETIVLLQGSNELYIANFVAKTLDQVKILNTLGIEGKVSVCGSDYSK